MSRAFLRDLLKVWEAEELTEVAELVTSELVANVVRHAVTAADVHVSWDDPILRIEVWDGSATLPAIRDRPGDDGGYGLHVVAALAREWGVHRVDDGKAVWFTVERGQGVGQASGS